MALGREWGVVARGRECNTYPIRTMRVQLKTHLPALYNQHVGHATDPSDYFLPIALSATAAAFRHSFFAQYQSGPTKAEDSTLIARAPPYFARHDAQRGNSHSRQRCLTFFFTVGP